MVALLQDVVSASLVLVGVGLLNEPDELERFRNAFTSELLVQAGPGLVTDMASGVTEPGRELTLGRERIRLTLHSSRSTIAIDYPDDDGLDRFAGAIASAVAFTDTKGRVPGAFGYNMDLVLDQDSEEPAIRYIGRGLFRSRLPEALGQNFVGGSGRLIATDTVGRWTIDVEPRFNDNSTSRIFLRVNLHKDEQRLPNEDEIRKALLQVKDRALAFAGGLDKCGE